MWVRGCVGLLAVRAIELLQICSQLLQCTGHNPNMVQMTSNSICLAFLCQHCTFRAPLLADILTYSDLPNSGASQEFGSFIQNRTEPHRKTSREAGLSIMYRLLKFHRIQGQLEQYEFDWIWDIVAQTYVLRLQSLHGFWRPLALHHSLAAWSTIFFSWQSLGIMIIMQSYHVISGARTDQYHIDKIHGQDGKVHQRPVCRNGNAPAISSPDLHVICTSLTRCFKMFQVAVLGSLIARASGNSTPSKKINCKAFNGFHSWYKSKDSKVLVLHQLHKSTPHHGCRRSQMVAQW